MPSFQQADQPLCDALWDSRRVMAMASQVRVFRQHHGAQLPILPQVEFARMDVDIGLDAERHLHILFVGDGDIDEPHQFAHHLHRGLAPLPEVLAVVEVAGNGEPLSARLLDGFERQRGRRGADGGGDAGDVEPSRAFQHGVPIDIARFGQRDGAEFAVVDHLGRALVGAGFQIIDAHAPLAADDLGRVDAPRRAVPLWRRRLRDGRWAAP